MLTVKKSLIASVLCAVTSVGFVMNASAAEKMTLKMMKSQYLRWIL